MRIIFTLILALCGAAAQAQTAAGKPARLIVAFQEDVEKAAREGILEGYGMKAVDELGIFNAVVAEAPGGKYHPSAMRLMSDPKVMLVEEDFTTNWIKVAVPSFQATPMPTLREVLGTLPKFEKKDGTAGEIPWGISRVKAPEAWATTEGAGVKVAVIDTGIDCTHPDLQANCAGGVNYVDSKKPPMDDNSHGTHVAGTIAAVRDDKGVVGVAPKVRLYAVKVLDAEGSGSLTSIVKGLVWAANNGIQVANLSLGAPMGSTFMRLAVAYAKLRGVALMCAAGNDGGSVNYPAAYSGAIAVSALDSKDKIAYFSSRGAEVKFIAPGVDVLSSVPGGRYDKYSGTSMATPHMAGLAALAVSRGAKGYDGVLAALKEAAEPVAGLQATEQGFGVVNAAKLVK